MDCRNEIVFENEHLGALFAAIQNQKYTIRKQEFSSVLPASAVIQCRAGASILDAKTSAAIQQIVLHPGEEKFKLDAKTKAISLQAFTSDLLLDKPYEPYALSCKIFCT